MKTRAQTRCRHEWDWNGSHERLVQCDRCDAEFWTLRSAKCLLCRFEWSLDWYTCVGCDAMNLCNSCRHYCPDGDHVFCRDCSSACTFCSVIHCVVCRPTVIGCNGIWCKKHQDGARKCMCGKLVHPYRAYIWTCPQCRRSGNIQCKRPNVKNCSTCDIVWRRYPDPKTLAAKARAILFSPLYLRRRRAIHMNVQDLFS
jgi:hypothetical protein